MMIRILNPWQGTFNRHGLAKHWWHRLAVVTFFLTLVLGLGASWVAFRPVHSYMDVEYWMNDIHGARIAMPPPPTPPPGYSVSEVVVGPPEKDGVMWDMPSADGTFHSFNAGERLSQQVYMPDGTSADFVPCKSDAEVRRIWNTALLKARTLSIAIAIGITLAFSYLLQSLYRVLLYVVYGTEREPVS
jgi:hypothetical protein